MNPEKVIVTVRDAKGHGAWDFELPADTPYKEYQYILLDELKRENPAYFGSWPNLVLYLESGQALLPNESLSSYGIWDGSVIIARAFTQE